MRLVFLALGILVLLVLFLPVTVFVAYHRGDLEIRLRVLLFTLRVYPQPEKPEKPQKKQAKARPKKEKPPPPPAKKLELDDVLELLELVQGFLPQVGETLGFLNRHFTIHRVRVAMLVAGEDAADTALRFGSANGVVYGVYTAAAAVFRVRDAVLDIRPNFLDNGEQWLEASGRLSMAPWVALWAGIRLGWAAFGTFRPILFPQKQQNKQEKAVQTNGN